MKNNKDIKHAISDLKLVSADKELQHATLLKEKAVHDKVSAINHAMRSGIEQGIKQGIEQGIEQGKKEIILNMLASNLSLEQIQQITKLSEKEIKELIK